MKLKIRTAIVIAFVIGAISSTMVAHPRIKELYAVQNLDVGKLHFTLAQMNATNQRARSNVISPSFSKASPAHVLISPRQPGASIGSQKISLAQHPDPYRPQKGGSCVGHAFGQLLRYTSWRYKCSSRAQCLSWDPPRPCPYFLWSVARCGPYTTLNGVLSSCRKDVGTSQFDMAKSVRTLGYVFQGDWKIGKQDISTQKEPFKFFPGPEVFAKARQTYRNYQIMDFSRAGDGRDMYNALLAGHAILFWVDAGNLTAERRTIAGWSVNVIRQETLFYGGHAMMFVGAIFDGRELYFQVQNSWGKKFDNMYMSLSDFRRRNGGALTLVWS